LSFPLQAEFANDALQEAMARLQRDMAMEQDEFTEKMKEAGARAQCLEEEKEALEVSNCKDIVRLGIN
jgi:high-affinity K+ transport system ATPase subunit B